MMRCILFVSVIRVITIEMSLLALDARSRVAQLTLVIKRAHSHWGGTYFPFFLPVLFRNDIFTCQTLVFDVLQHFHHSYSTIRMSTYIATQSEHKVLYELSFFFLLSHSRL